MLFGLLIEKLYSVDPNLVEVQLVDKLIRPWELLVERGIQNESTEDYGFWNQKLDSSIVILRSWLFSTSQETSISQEFKFSKRFEKLIPFWMHLSGQLLNDLESEKVSKDNHGFRLSKDLSFIIKKIIGGSIFKEPRKFLNFLLDEGKNGSNGYFKMSNIERNTSRIKEVENEKTQLQYEIKISILEDSEDEEKLLDFKLESLKLILKEFERKASLKILILLMADCLQSWTGSNQVTVDDSDARFVPELQSMSRNPKKFASVYILGSVADLLTDLETDYDNEILIDMLKIVDVSCFVIKRVIDFICFRLFSEQRLTE